MELTVVDRLCMGSVPHVSVDLAGGLHHKCSS